MPDYAGLKAEIGLSKYNGLTDDQISVLLETPIVVTKDVPVSTVEGYLRSRMLMGGIQRFIANPPAGVPAALLEGLSELLGMCSSPHVDNVAMTDPAVSGAVQQILGGAVSFSLMTQANMDDLLAMGVYTTTRASQLQLVPDIHEITSEIAAARIWPGVSV